MTAGAATAAATPPRQKLWPVAVALAATLAGLWLALQWPAVTVLLEPLTTLTAAATALLLAALGLPVMRESNVLVHAGGFACEIDIACTALVPAALLTVALLSWRRPWRARLAGALGGIVWLVVVNELRLVTLVWVGVHAPGGFDVLHRWVWPALLALAAAGYFLMQRRAGRGCD